MALLERSAWYDIARDTNWTPKYVDADELFPPDQSDPYGIPVSEWEKFDEPYKVSYREYVSVQREKDAGAYSVKAALARSSYYEDADPAYLSMLKLHYGAIALSEYAACQSDARMTRFSKAPGMRNMATFGMLDELRHGQIQLYFPHQLVSLDRQFDWAHQAHHSKNWAAIAGRHALDDVMMTRDAVTTSIMLNFAFETGLTNIQMIGLSADAANMGDYTFSNLITSIQSDEARHAQIGTPVLEIMVKNGRKAEAQQAVDIAFWRIHRIFAILTGIPMDYWIPLEKRDRSFKEYMTEFVGEQFERQLLDLGLERPWYWDIFLEDVGVHHHCQAAATWAWRNTLWWNPTGNVGPRERAWLEEKYPGWNDTFGMYWDVMIENIRAGHPEKSEAIGMPAMCNMCQIPISNKGGTVWEARAHQLEHEGRLYSFCSTVCKWIFELEPDRYKTFNTIADRMYNGEISPNTPENILQYMGAGVISQGGRDAHDLAWVKAYDEVEAPRTPIAGT
ncbi:YHS domain-containing protein [Pseudonocardia xishanensis]|uniref:propane 2-monooxygenase n=1 Tax=Pseudonocardia xishanensis TaxID=630995 RepID=A0ABP8S115_9PSEU